MNHKIRLLLVEDDAAYARRLKKNLEMDNFVVSIALGGETALKHLAKEDFDLVITDIKMPDMDGMEFIDVIRRGDRPELDTDIPLVVLSSVNSVESAVNAMKRGAADYITKESERPEIILRLKKVLEQYRMANENIYLKNQLEKRDEFTDFIGETSAILKIKKEISELAKQDVSTLLIGETGVGKELVARALHRLRGPGAGPFIDMNCAGLPDDGLIQSDLFGHEQGAFTGAQRQRKGKFELAGDGSLFLDEISELSPASQGKILKVIENRKLTRLGGSKEIPIRCRFIFATNKDLLSAVREGRFREDLYYRINVYPIKIPPLRDRKDDIPLLAQYFINFFCEKYRKPQKRLEDNALKRLQSYPWPGNIRELRNIMERLIFRTHGEIISGRDVDNCGMAMEPSSCGSILLPAEGVQLDKLEKDLTRQALERTEWNQKQAAKLLGISVDRMNSRVRKFGFTHSSWRRHKP